MLLGRAVENALPTLLGMAVDYTPTLDGHDARCKVGVITSAELVAGAKEGQAKGQRIEIAGFLYAKDFPEIVGEIEERGPQKMGMSYEIADVRVADANAPVWAITDFKFTGAALLLREKAAYSDTWVSVQ